MLDLEKSLRKTLTKKTHQPLTYGADIESRFPSGTLDPSGMVFHHSIHHPLSHPVGMQTCTPQPPVPLLRSYAQLSSSHPRLLFIDTETTGLAGGSGTYAFLIGAGYFSDTDFVTQQFFLKSPAGEAPLLIAVDALMQQFDTVVSYNGKSFDVPLLRTRCIMNQMPCPADTMAHLDLLHPARRLWKNSIGSCTLQNIEAYVLGHHRQLEADIPGRDIPDAYFRYLDTHDATDMQLVMQHNDQDIYSLAALLTKMNELLAAPVLHDELVDPAAVGRLWEEYGSIQEALDFYTFLAEKGSLSGESRQRMAMLCKQQKNWEKATTLWEADATTNWQSCEELAKYAEHHVGDFVTALKWTNTALALLENSYLLDSARVAALHHRKKRLEQRRDS